MRRGGGGGGGHNPDEKGRTDSVSVEIFSRGHFDTAFIRGYELDALVKARKKKRIFRT